MLLEVTNNRFKIGDTVLITATGQVGRIVALEGTRWTVAIDGGGQVLKESTEIETRQALFG